METKMGVAAQVAALDSMDLAALREEWVRRYGPAPKGRSPELLRLQIAWRIQAAVHGGLSQETRARLTGRQATAQPSTQIGTRLVREWKGVEHEVIVADGGFF